MLFDELITTDSVNKPAVNCDDLYHDWFIFEPVVMTFIYSWIS